MKKLVFLTILLLLSTTTASAEEQLNFSLMEAELPKQVFTNDIIEEPMMSFFGDVDLGYGEYESWEDEFYNKLDSIYSPDNIVNQRVGRFDNSNSYYILAPYVDFKIDNSLGTIDQQVWIRAEQIHEVYTRYLQNNPEYFYLIPRQYGASHKSISDDTIRIQFAPVVAYDLPGFDGSKGALTDIRNKYYRLMEEIEKAREEIYFEGMTDLDKLLLAHDYITDNTAYYLTYDNNGNSCYGNGYSYNSYGILVNKQGVCQGLSYAYPCLLKALGYPIENIRQIRSDEIKHMWNFVKLDDDWYHVDLTWDDPLYASSSGKYDISDDAFQYEHHEHFLISNDTNTVKRNAKGYEGFTLEILGYEDTDYLLADNKSYESGWFFNDPVNNALTEIPGRVEYSDGLYRKYYLNNDVCFTSDTLKAPKYLISDITYNQYDVPLVWILGSGERTRPAETVTQYVSYYKGGRFEDALVVNQTLSGFGMHPIYDFKEPEDGGIVKIITVDKNFSPVGNVSIIE